MRCTSPITIRSPSSGLFYGVRCFQCLACRITKKDWFTLRCLLETRTAITSQFWTLTYRDGALPTTQGLVRTQVRAFFSAFRASERRSGNTNMIRYFGCLEYGGKFGRPHVHLLIWNAARNFVQAGPYMAGLPRPQYHTGLWPHGHVDIGNVDTGSINYVAGYLTDFVEPEAEPVMFKTIRPLVGYSGICSLAELTYANSATVTGPPTSVMYGNRRFSLDRPTQGVFLHRFRSIGGTVCSPTGVQKKQNALREAMVLELQTPEWLKKQHQERRNRYVETVEAWQAQRDIKERQISEIAFAYAS